jgi:hypothetical protein
VSEERIRELHAQIDRLYDRIGWLSLVLAGVSALLVIVGIMSVLGTLCR